MPKAYQYDETTKKYVGEIDRQLDPLESKQLGHDVWLMPANSTDVPPLEEKENFDVIWNGSEWEYQEIPQTEPEPEYEPTPEEQKQMRAEKLKMQLSDTDYKIIKCSECSLAGVELPYDIVALHTERQALRDEINQLETQE